MEQNNIKRYLKNLFRALLGKNPYKMEWEELTEMLEKTSERVRSLNDLYFNSLGVQLEMKTRLDDLQSDIKKKEYTYQVLTENLRERIKCYESQIAEYRKELSRLNEKKKNGKES